LQVATENARRLTEAEKTQFRERGYVKNLPAFDAAAVSQLQQRFDELLAKLPDGTDINKVNCWHKANRWVYDICKTPAILDCVEDLLGQDMFLWGCQFFCKLPGVSTDVPWHQDSQYWPLTPKETVTVWLALYNTDDSNGAMRVVAGSHRQGMHEHSLVEGEKFVLAQGIDEKQFDANDVVTIDLQAGEMSLHDDGLIHGSGPSTSGQRRVGLAMRLSPATVKCDLSEWPNFEAYQMRGENRFQHNPEGKVPTGDAVPTKMFPLSSEFA
jgi:non-heme Fe2+,alpha-ketoglutarate-dependent halogenase